MLSISNLSFSYNNQKLFDDLNISIEAGEKVYLIGKSGSGKSSLFQLIYRNLIPDSGKIIVDNYDTDTIKTKDIPYLRRKIGIVFQDFKLLNDRNVFDNLAFVLKATGTPLTQIKKKVINTLSEVGLSHKQKSFPLELSGGERQRIAIARAIINDPLIILADEPTGNLDPETTESIIGTLNKINQRGTTLFLATHNYNLVKNSDARILKLENGKVLKVKIKKRLPDF